MMSEIRHPGKPVSTEEVRSLFLRKGLDEIPKILTLQDRNPHSPTYGCFDRNFWHYKIIDFPSGMSQELVWPLALAWMIDAPWNPYYAKESVRDWVIAGMRYACHSSHSDGSCDDYYRFEKASGAAAFSLLAMLESFRILESKDRQLIEFFTRRADWLSKHMESGKLANHQALIALCLQLAGDLVGSDRFEEAKKDRLDTVLSWQSREGWFSEYQGFDPGYHTLTITCLSWLHRINPGFAGLETALSRAIDLAVEFIHPDGTCGGEYGSRNTNNYFSAGFEIAGSWKPESLYANDRYARAVLDGLTPCFSDDHILGHHAWNDLLTCLHFNSERDYHAPVRQTRVWLPEAGVLIDRRDGYELYTSLNKGGVFKLFREGKLLMADTGISAKVTHRRRELTAVSHLAGGCRTEIDEDSLSVNGSMGMAKQKQMNTFNLIVLRMFMCTFGRFFPDLVRKLLQALLITGKNDAGLSFNRQFDRIAGGWKIRDEISADDWAKVSSIGLGCDQTSIYVVMSRTFHTGNLFRFVDLSPSLKRLAPGEKLVHERTLR